jgi:hypothetical protein
MNDIFVYSARQKQEEWIDIYILSGYYSGKTNFGIMGIRRFRVAPVALIREEKIGEREREETDKMTAVCRGLGLVYIYTSFSN